MVFTSLLARPFRRNGLYGYLSSCQYYSLVTWFLVIVIVIHIYIYMYLYIYIYIYVYVYI